MHSTEDKYKGKCMSRSKRVGWLGSRSNVSR